VPGDGLAGVGDGLDVGGMGLGTDGSCMHPKAHYPAQCNKPHGWLVTELPQQVARQDGSCITCIHISALRCQHTLATHTDNLECRDSCSRYLLLRRNMPQQMAGGRCCLPRCSMCQPGRPTSGCSSCSRPRQNMLAAQIQAKLHKHIGVQGVSRKWLTEYCRMCLWTSNTHAHALRPSDTKQNGSVPVLLVGCCFVTEP
jgi:hypothetical protein